jgi:hypothetical protein
VVATSGLRQPKVRNACYLRLDASRM